MTRKIKKSILFISVLFAACGTQQNNENKEDSLKKIDSLESKMRASAIIDNVMGNALINSYVKFSKDFPEEAKCPEYLFKAGEIASSIRQGQQAIDIFHNVYEKYPDYDKAHYCLFLQGFIYETQLNNKEKAKEFYLKVIERYPNDPLATDAKACIQNLGKTDEELIKEFEEKNKGS